MAPRKKAIKSKRSPKVRKSNPTNLVLDLLKEVREDQRITHETLSKMDIKLVKIESNVDKNTEDLAEHIEGVLQNRERLEKLEDSFRDIKSEERGRGKALKNAGIVAGVLAGIASVVYNVINFFKG